MRRTKTIVTQSRKLLKSFNNKFAYTNCIKLNARKWQTTFIK